MLDLAGSVPGKLMIAGEYAVLQPPALALAVAVGRLVSWQAASDGQGALHLRAFGAESSLTLTAAESALGLPGFAGRAWAAGALAWPMVGAPSVWLDVFGAVDGKKLGLGNSAAVTVAVLRARAALAGATPSATVITDLARAAHRQGQAGQGSGYDVATIAQGGIVAFEPATGATAPLSWPEGLAAVALYAGEPAATADALPRAQAMAPWLPGIAKAAMNLRDVWAGEVAGVLRALSACEAAAWAAEPVRAALFPPSVQRAQQFLRKAGLVPRLSGAGGGDCVLGFGVPAEVTAAADAWRSAGGVVAAQLPADLAPATREFDV